MTKAQELKCNVSVLSQAIQGTNKKVFTTLQTALNEFVNNHVWTSHQFLINERIECTMLINITDYSSDEFKGTMTVQSRRPVYNSSYSSTMLNFVDNQIDFHYVEFQPLEFNETSNTNSLTSTMAYYVYIILGMDYDSFSLEGGYDYFKKAETIVNNMQNSSDAGWSPNDGKNNRNRYWLVKNIMDKNYDPCREFIYKYHRLGLDLLDTKPNEGRAEILSDLDLLQKVYLLKPDPYMFFLLVIFDAKADEFVNIFSEGLPDEKVKAFNILNDINNSNATKYAAINKAAPSENH
jgi:hypothetical protein